MENPWFHMDFAPATVQRQGDGCGVSGTAAFSQRLGLHQQGGLTDGLSIGLTQTRHM